MFIEVGFERAQQTGDVVLQLAQHEGQPIRLDLTSRSGTSTEAPHDRPTAASPAEPHD